jgi:hypothetical protein
MQQAPVQHAVHMLWEGKRHTSQVLRTWVLAHVQVRFLTMVGLDTWERACGNGVVVMSDMDQAKSG